MPDVAPEAFSFGGMTDPDEIWRSISETEGPVIVTRLAVEDGLVRLSDLQADPLWERDFFTYDWHKRTPEFLAERAAAEEALVDQRKNAQIALAAALISLERELPSQADNPACGPIAPNGQPYVIIASQPLKWGGDNVWECSTSAQAIAAWKRAMLDYVAANPGDILWWRVRPEIDGHVYFGETKLTWMVYSRLMIGNEADTPLARIAAGTLRPFKLMDDKIVTAEQLAELGWVMDDAMGCPVLSKFDAEKLPQEVRRAFSATIEALPPVIADLPKEAVYSYLHIQSQGVGATLTEAVMDWSRSIRSQIGETNLQWLWWRQAPCADVVVDFTGDELRRWVMYSRATFCLSSEAVTA